MNKTTATNAQGRQVLKHIARIGPFLPASLTITRTRCGNACCRCAKEGPIHETALLTWKEGGTTHTLYVPRDLRHEVAQCITEWKKLKRLIERMGAAQRQFLQTRKKNNKKPSGPS